MADLRYYDIIDKPVITEKSMAGMEYKRYILCSYRSYKVPD